MRWITLVVLLLAGCGQEGEVAIKRVIVENEAELARYCTADPMHSAIGLYGCAKGGAMSTPRSSVCTIYTLKERGYDDHRRVETLGHELKHCLEGPAHT